MMMWHGSWTGADWALMSVLMVVFWTLAAAGVLWLISTQRGSGPAFPQPPTSQPASPGSQARAILDDRLASGELSTEDYQTRRDLLTPG
jgi:uncharacterized membrane protein